MAIPKDLILQRYLSVFGVDVSSQQTKKEYIAGTQYNYSYYYCKCPECGKFAYESIE